MSQKQSKYNSSSIETLRFPDSIRRSPGMYLGSVDADGVWLCAREALDNIVDEALAGRATTAHLHISKDNSYWVQDDADGIPQGLKKVPININGKKIISKMPTMQAIFGELHTSGKFHSEAYKVSRGTHGVGVKGSNATAEYFDVWTFYKGKWYTIGFERGELTRKVDECKPPKRWDGQTLKKGTLIHFKPDAKIFTSKSFPLSRAVEWAELAAHLHPGFRIILSNEKSNKTFFSKKGPVEYVQRMIEKVKATQEPKMFQYKSELADVIVAFTNCDGFNVRGFVNGLSQPSGGKHLDSVAGALYAGLKPFIKTRKVKIEGKKKEVLAFRESDLKEGLMGLVNLYLHKATYSSQDKARLTDDRAGAPFEELLTEATKAFFKENKTLAQRLADRAAQLNELKTKFTLSKAAAGKLNAARKNGLPAKYASFDIKTKPHDRELFLVEGDSAGGGAKEARFPYQAVLPLKGKVLNVLKDKKNKTFESEEIINILAAIGYDVKAANPYEKLTVGKIICLADPDPDGPFIGTTPIRVIINGEECTEKIEHLANTDVDFKVLAWNGSKEVLTSASASLVKNTDTLVALEIGGVKYKVDPSHKWMCVITSSLYGRKTTPTPFDNLVYVASEDLKIGDRVFLPTQNGTKNPSHTDKQTKLGYAPVSKLRIQKLQELVPVYCLTVPGQHNFILPNGIVSSNCHINSLLLTLFYRYLPELFNMGMIYVANTPEFYATHKGQLVTGDTLSEVQTKLVKIKAPSNVAISHIKGWGEIDSSLMKILAMDPSTRKVIQIKAIESADRTDFVRLMNDDVLYRKKMLNLPDAVIDSEERTKPKKGKNG